MNNIKKQITSDFCDISKLESNENLKLFIKEFEQKGTFQGIYMYVKLIIYYYYYRNKNISRSKTKSENKI